MRKIIITFILILLISTVSVSAFRLADYITGNAVAGVLKELSPNTKKVVYQGCTYVSDGSVRTTKVPLKRGVPQYQKSKVVVLVANRRGTIAYTCINSNEQVTDQVFKLKGRGALNEATRRHNQFNSGLPGGLITPEQEAFAEGINKARNAHMLAAILNGNLEHCKCIGSTQLDFDLETTQSRKIRNDRTSLNTFTDNSFQIRTAQTGIKVKSLSDVQFTNEENSPTELSRLLSTPRSGFYHTTGSAYCKKEFNNFIPVDYSCGEGDSQAKNAFCNQKCNTLLTTDFNLIKSELQFGSGNGLCKNEIKQSLSELIPQFDVPQPGLTPVTTITLISNQFVITGMCANIQPIMEEQPTEEVPSPSYIGGPPPSSLSPVPAPK